MSLEAELVRAVKALWGLQQSYLQLLEEEDEAVVRTLQVGSL